MVIFLGNTVGDIGEGSGTFIGGHHQIGVIVVMADNIHRRYDFVAFDVIGDIQQGPNKGAVALFTFVEEGFPAAAGR